MANPVGWFEVSGPDAGGLQRFYAEAFGWEIDADNEMNYGMVSRDGNTAPDGVGIGGGIGQGPDGYDGHVTFYVAVDDVEAALQKGESLGGTRVMGPEEISGMLIMGHLKDPEGHLIGVVKPLDM
jgi:predicted enzyme related to lactoylglutathione lyase